MSRNSPVRRMIGLSVATLFGAAALVACGDSGTTEAAPAVCDLQPSAEAVAEAKESLQGKTITFVVDRSPGGGYDQYARMVAPYLAKDLGATVIVENQPGAGGIVAMNALSAKKATGQDIATFNAPGLVPATIADYQGVQFSPSELTWLGRMAGEPDLVVVPVDSPFQTFADLLAAKGVSFGSSGPGAADYVSPAVLIEAFGMDAEVVTGYDGSSEIELGMLRGDVDAMTGTLDSRLPALENGTTRALAVISNDRLEELPDVPTLFEFDPDEQAQAILKAHIQVKDIGRPIVAPPGMDDAMTVALRDSVERALQDPELLKDSEKLGRPIGFLSGVQQCELVQDLLDAPEAYRTVLREAYKAGDLE